MNKKGFTLVEVLSVLIVLALIALLVSGLFVKTIKKSETGVKETQEQAILNAAEKWSINNSEQFDDITGVTTYLGLDVLYIVDSSGSMRRTMVGSLTGKSVAKSRFYATMKAINISMSILSSEKNNIMITTFGEQNESEVLLPLASYYSPTGEYFEFRGDLTKKADTNYKIYSTSDLKKRTESGMINVSTVSTKFNQSDTYIQEGIYFGTNQLINSRNNPKNLIPVVIFITDGLPTDANSYFCLSCSVSERNKTGLERKYYYTLKTAVESKKRIEDYYGKEVFFYTIGFGIDGSEQGKQILDPGSYEKLKDYNYVTKSFQQEEMTAEELQLVFSQIATEVIEATKITQVCVSVEQLYNAGYLSEKDIKLADGSEVAKYVIMDENENGEEGKTST